MRTQHKYNNISCLTLLKRQRTYALTIQKYSMATNMLCFKNKIKNFNVYPWWLCKWNKESWLVFWQLAFAVVIFVVGVHLLVPHQDKAVTEAENIDQWFSTQLTVDFFIVVSHQTLFPTIKQNYSRKSLSEIS